MYRKIKVLVVDDHPLFREGIKAILERSPEFEVVGEAGDGDAGLELTRQLKPELALVDISLAGENGLDLVQSIKKIQPGICVLILSMHSKMDYIIEAFQAGANGYMVKESAGEGLLNAMKRVGKGEYFIDASISSAVVHEILKNPKKQDKIIDGPYRSLTSREQEIMRLLAENRTPKEIGDQLFISSKTVDNHRANIMRKLELQRPLDLVRYAARIGLIDTDRWKE